MVQPTSLSLDPVAAAEFARDVVQRLQNKGFQAFWAGGCVRDRLMGLEPKDYDVATNATPEQVRLLFGRRRTLLIGAAFGVVTVLGPRRAGQIEVATFRRDEGYSDGRHPDQVAYSTAEEDALRRDFTINGLFYDPASGQILDFVGGQADIQRGVVRCIGDPHDRIDEDKLRMLRGVRFATVLGFEIDPETNRAIEEHADEIERVSAERIAAEMRRVLIDRHHTVGLELLRATGLWRAVLPEYALDVSELRDPNWHLMIVAFGQLPTPLDMALACATLMWPICQTFAIDPVVDRLAERWRLTNREQKSIKWLLAHVSSVRTARRLKWPKLQRILVNPLAPDLMALARASVIATDGPEADMSDWQFCRERLSWPPSRLNPSPLISGHELKQIGIRGGPTMGRLLEAVRDAQLEGDLHSTAEAIAWAKTRWESSSRHGS